MTPLMTLTTVVTVTAALVSSGCLPSSHGFSVRANGVLRRQPVWRRTGTGPVMSTDMTQEAEAEAAAMTATATASAEWWEEFELKDEALAQQVRGDFPILNQPIAPGSDLADTKDLVYLDSAATSQKPTAVLAALDSYYRSENSNVHRGAHVLSRKATASYEGARDAVASFIHASSRNEVIFTSGATQALNLVAASYGRSTIQKDDEIILSEMEHHSNIVPWQVLAEEKGAILKVVPMNKETGHLDMDVFQSLLSDKTKIVTLQHVSNVAACINPIKDIVALTRSKAHPDAKIVLDACQSVPHMPVNVQELGVDFLAASGHKFCAPTGIGFLWGREDLLNAMPPYMGGGEMIDEVFMDHSTFAKAPARFEAGTPAIAQAIGMGAAIAYIQNLGMERIEAYEHELSDYLYRRLSEVPGVTVLGPSDTQGRAALCTFVCEGIHPSDLSTFLDMEGVAIRAGHHCCQPFHRSLGYSHSARASLYFYNTKADIDTFLQHLQDTLRFFGNLGGGNNDNAANGEDADEFVPFI